MAQEVEWVSLGYVNLTAANGNSAVGLLSVAKIFETIQYKIKTEGSEYHVIDVETTIRGLKYNSKAGDYYFNK